MFKCMFILIGFLASFLPLNPASAMDCSPLDPRAKLSEKVEAKAQASALTMFKIVKAGGDVEGKLNKEMANWPVSENLQIKQRKIYLFCGMVANATDISTERKVDLYNIMVEQKDKRSAKKGKRQGSKKAVKSSQIISLAEPQLVPKETVNQSQPQQKVDASDSTQNINSSPNAMQIINNGSVTINQGTVTPNPMTKPLTSPGLDGGKNKIATDIDCQTPYDYISKVYSAGNGLIEYELSPDFDFETIDAVFYGKRGVIPRDNTHKNLGKKIVGSFEVPERALRKPIQRGFNFIITDMKGCERWGLVNEAALQGDENKKNNKLFIDHISNDPKDIAYGITEIVK